MPPHLHPKSRSTSTLFAGTLLASLVVVGLPHLFPCPAPRRTFTDSDMTMAADGQQVPRMRRRRRKETELDSDSGPSVYPTTPSTAEDEVSTFFEMEAEAKRMAQVGHECPVPKPKGVLGELLGFRNARAIDPAQTQTGKSLDEGR
ncbi:Uncharacterized protein PECH_003431 [Penicillium ucsense]|uniref:Alpha-1,3-mannosyltransferase n=1 Tax=Penicillium ucsense TaxID=2839758 RepID=A0A8J8W9M1_9EURO|nr:Uncharacterized protein PECM_000241 [Penicillium ucsense]KAF7739452.1 Uncharacterized protein PECH_003431 [Penicillium ucsense]